MTAINAYKIKIFNFVYILGDKLCMEPILYVNLIVDKGKLHIHDWLKFFLSKIVIVAQVHVQEALLLHKPACTLYIYTCIYVNVSV